MRGTWQWHGVLPEWKNNLFFRTDVTEQFILAADNFCFRFQHSLVCCHCSSVAPKIQSIRISITHFPSAVAYPIFPFGSGVGIGSVNHGNNYVTVTIFQRCQIPAIDELLQVLLRDSAVSSNICCRCTVHPVAGKLPDVDNRDVVESFQEHAWTC